MLLLADGNRSLVVAGTTRSRRHARLEGVNIETIHQRRDIMGVKLTYLAPLLAAGAAAVMISAAPIASAESTTQQSCNETVSGSVCESPGNVELNDTPAPMDFQPYGEDGWLIGGFGGFGGFGDHGGGFHGGGGGHR
jgi:hypothetical protein